MNVHCLLLWKPVVDAGCFHDSLRWQTCSDRQSQTYRSAPWSISTRLTSVMYFCHDGVFGGFVMQQCSHGHSSVHELAQGMLNNEPIVVVSSDGSEQVCVGVPKRVVSVSTAPEDQLRRIDIIICNHRSPNDVSTTRLSKSSREGPYQFTRTRL